MKSENIDSKVTASQCTFCPINPPPVQTSKVFQILKLFFKVANHIWEAGIMKYLALLYEKLIC